MKHIALMTTALLSLLGLCAAQAQTVTVTDLNPPGYTSSVAQTVAGGMQVGYGYNGQGSQALVWKGTAASAVNLNGSVTYNAMALGVAGNVQVGAYSSPPQAALWTGTPDSLINLNPPGIYASEATAVSGDIQVGELVTDGGFHATLWRGTADCVVDLNPAGFTQSFAWGVSGDTEVGYGDLASGSTHALRWKGTAASGVDINPAGYSQTRAYGVSGDTIVGWGYPPQGLNVHALLWTDTGVVDLHPDGYTTSAARAVSNGVEVGYANTTGDTGGREDALLWRGSAGSVLNLAASLPAGYDASSRATGIEGSGNVYNVVGYAENTIGVQHAFLWHVVFATAAKPVLTDLEPATRTEGREAFTLTVTGTNFTASSKVRWNGQAQTTTFVSATQLTAAIPASLIASPGTTQVTVSTSGVGTSNAHAVVIMARPTLTSLSPASKKAGSAAFILTVTGTNFRPASFYAPTVVKWNGAELATTYVSATKLTAQVPASLLHAAGTQQITVTTPQVASSVSKSFTITP